MPDPSYESDVFAKLVQASVKLIIAHASSFGNGISAENGTQNTEDRIQETEFGMPGRQGIGTAWYGHRAGQGL